MNSSILVTYATRAGSTAGIAAEIAKMLCQAGFSTDLYPMQAVIDLAPYRVVIAGSAIQGGAWLPEAMTFFAANRSALRLRKVATFLVCMMLAGDESTAERQAYIDHWMAPVRTIVTPLYEGAFAGALDLAKIQCWRDRIGMRLSLMFAPWGEGDYRDWDAIDSWTAELIARLGVRGEAARELQPSELQSNESEQRIERDRSL